MPKFLNNIDLDGNQLENVVIHVTSDEPDPPTTGQIFFDSTGGVLQLKVYNGSAWQGLATEVSDTDHIFNTALKVGYDSTSHLDFTTDDTIDIYLNNAKDFVFTANTFTAETGSTIAGKAITGTTIDASTDFTIGDTVITSNTITGTAMAIAGGSGEIDLTTTGAIDINGNAVTIDSTDDLTITTTSSTAGEDLTIQQAGGNDSSIIITAAGTGADAVSIDASAGSMLIAPNLINGKTLTIGPSSATQMVFTPHGTAGNEKISITNTAGTATDAIKIFSDAGGITLEADSTNAAAIDIDSAGGIDIDASGAISIQAVDEQTVSIGLNGASETIWSPSSTTGNELWSTINTAGTTDGADAAGAILLSAVAGGIGLAWADDKDLWAEGGQFVVTANHDAADAIKLHADAGTSQTIQIVNDEGTSESAIALTSTAGGVNIDAASGKDVDIAGGQINLTSAHNTANSIYLRANAGTSETIKIHSDLGTGAGSIEVTSDAGSIDINSGDNITVDAADLITLTTADTGAAGKISLVSGVAGSNTAIHLDGDANAASIVDIDAGILDIDVAGAYTLDATGVSIDSDAASNLTTSSGALTITSAAAATWSTAAGVLTIDGDDGIVLNTSGSGDVLVTDSLVVGVDATGEDVRFYSNTTNEGLLYDASEDELGLLLTTKLKFHDIGGGEEIYASANGHLEINAGTTLDITAPTVDVNASTAVTIDGPAVTVADSADGKPVLTIKTTHTTKTSSGELQFLKDAADTEDGEVLGQITFYGEDEGNNNTQFAGIVASISESDASDEAGTLELQVAESDGTTTTMTTGLKLEGEHATDGQIDVTIGAGSGSTTTIAGDLVVSGATTTVTSTTVATGDSMIELAKDQDDSADAVDFGIYGVYGVSDQAKYAGIFRDQDVSGDPWTFFDTLEEKPGTTVNISGTNYDLADISAGGITAADGFTGDISGDVTGNADTATALATSRNLQVALATTSAQGFTGAANATSIGVSGALAVGNGGTGQTSLDANAVLVGNSTSGITSSTNLSFDDTDLTLAGGGKMEFRDNALYVYSSTDGQLDLVADTEIQIAATTIDINGAADISGATTITGALTTGGGILSDTTNTDALGTSSVTWSDLYLGDSSVIYFGEDQEITLTHSADAGVILKHADSGDDKYPTLTLQAGDDDIAVSDKLGVINFQAPDEGAGVDAVLVAAGIEAVSEGNFAADNNATKLSFKTAASAAAAETMSLSSTGVLYTAGAIELGAASDTTVARSAAGKVTIEDELIGTVKKVILLHGAGGVTGTTNNTTNSDTWTITHGMGNSFYYKAEVILNSSPYDTVYVDVTRPTNETVKIDFGSAVANSAYAVLLTRMA